VDDTNAIVELKKRYVRLVDGKEWSSLATCLSDDFEFDGQFLVRGAEAFVDRIKADLSRARTVHSLGTPVIEISGGDRARAVWPFSDVIDQRREGSGIYRSGAGHYHERYAQRGGHWMITAMRITRERVDCEVYRAGELIRADTCLSQDELVEWLNKERTS
jgi:hypothetical protein